MKTALYIFLTGLFSSAGLFAQTGSAPPEKRSEGGHFYFTFGWHRVYYTNSTIHFKDLTTADYDFRLIKAKAIDDNDLQIGNGIDAPQYSARLGWFFRKKPNSGIEINFDHAKYVLKQGQQVKVEGRINGNILNKDSLLHRNFIEYEHTDGANYWMLNYVRRKDIWQSKNQKHSAEYVLKPGIGLVIPRSDTRILGQPRNDKYHVSGYVAGVETGMRAVLFKKLVAEFTCKAAYANYTDVLLYGDGRARQHWFSFQYILLLGWQIDI